MTRHSFKVSRGRESFIWTWNLKYNFDCEKNSVVLLTNMNERTADTSLRSKMLILVQKCWKFWVFRTNVGISLSYCRHCHHFLFFLSLSVHIMDSQSAIYNIHQYGISISISIINIIFSIMVSVSTACSYHVTYSFRVNLQSVRTHIQMRSTDKYWQHSPIIWSVWLNGWVFIYELSGCGFESRCFHLNFRYGICFKQGFPSHSGKL